MVEVGQNGPEHF